MELIKSVMSLDRFAENRCIHVAWSTVIAWQLGDGFGDQALRIAVAQLMRVRRIFGFGGLLHRKDEIDRNNTLWAGVQALHGTLPFIEDCDVRGSRLESGVPHGPLNQAPDLSAAVSEDDWQYRSGLRMRNASANAERKRASYPVKNAQRSKTVKVLSRGYANESSGASKARFQKSGRHNALRAHRCRFAIQSARN
jgi:hypothetical protein